LTSHVLIQLHTRFNKASNNPITLCCMQVLPYTLFITAQVRSLSIVKWITLFQYARSTNLHNCYKNCNEFSAYHWRPKCPSPNKHYKIKTAIQHIRYDMTFLCWSTVKPSILRRRLMNRSTTPMHTLVCNTKTIIILLQFYNENLTRTKSGNVLNVKLTLRVNVATS